MYALNATDGKLDLDLILFSPPVQRYLSQTAKVPFIKKNTKGMFFRRTNLLKQALLEAPLWVKEIIREEAKIIE